MIFVRSQAKSFVDFVCTVSKYLSSLLSIHWSIIFSSLANLGTELLIRHVIYYVCDTFRSFSLFTVSFISIHRFFSLLFITIPRCLCTYEISWYLSKMGYGLVILIGILVSALISSLEIKKLLKTLDGYLPCPVLV